MLQDAATEINWIRMALVSLNGVITSTTEVLESCFTNSITSGSIHIKKSFAMTGCFEITIYEQWNLLYEYQKKLLILDSIIGEL